MATTETRIIDSTTTADEIDAWVRPHFAGVSTDDLTVNNRDGFGTDDVPRLSMTEQTHDDASRRVYGDWGVSREIRWADHDGDPIGSVMSGGHVLSVGQYVTAFVAGHGSVKLTLTPALHNRR